MAACEVNIKGLNVVVHYDYTPADYENGYGDESELTGVFVLGNDETVDDDECKNIQDVLGFSELKFLETACREDGKKTQRLGEEV